MTQGRSPRSAQLRQLWQQGERGRAIKGVLDGWDELLASNDDLDWLVEALRQSGLPAEGFAAQAVLARRRRGDLRTWEALIRTVLQSGDPWWARELLAEAGVDAPEIQALRIEIELRLGDPSPLIAAWARDHRDEPAVNRAVDWWVRSGGAEHAQELLARSEGTTVWRARFALWRNQPKAARALLDTLVPSPEVRCLNAVATILEGALPAGETLLRELLDSEAKAEAWGWLAAVLRKQGRFAEAIAAADAANIESVGFNFAARLERELAADYERLQQRQARIPAPLTRLLRAIGLGRHKTTDLRSIDALEHAEVLYLLGLSPQDSIEKLETVLDRFAGNRTANLTLNDPDGLRSFHFPPDAREVGASLQLVLWTRGPAAARALYREHVAQMNEHPLLRIYQGELELWLGEYETAARIFRDILAHHERTLWAWIGLGASLMFQGDLPEAQKAWQKGMAVMRFAGPTLYVYRGECYRLQGEHARAREDLETALRQKPQRLSARINLALLEDEPTALAQVDRDCVAFAPILMAQLEGDHAQRLGGVLEAMRGNRSSSPWHMSYHLWGRIWRRPTKPNHAPT